MKYSRAAAIVAGSVVAMGAASPAVAAGHTSMPPMSLNGGLAQTLGSVSTMDLAEEPVVGTVTQTALSAKDAKDDAPDKVLKTVGQVPPMLGGIELGG